MYDANELQAQFQAVAAVQRSMATTARTSELVPDAANVALSITDPQGRVLLLTNYVYRDGGEAIHVGARRHAQSFWVHAVGQFKGPSDVGFYREG